VNRGQAAGDDFQQLYRRYRGKVFALCFNLTGHREDAEDALQETFLGVARGLPRFRGEASLGTWIYRIALRQGLRVRERRRRSQEVRQAAEAPYRTAPPPGEGPGAAAIAAAMDQLSLEQRCVVVLCALDGLTGKEVARILDIKEGTVHSRLHAARKRLAELLGR